MDKKNTMLLTVIAVATLLVAVVGATFAYFTATNEASGSTTANVTTEAVGTVALSGSAALHLYLDENDMLESVAGSTGKTFWATAGSANYAGAQEDVVTSKLTVSKGETGTVYNCSYTLTVTPNGDYALLERGDAAVVFTLGADVTMKNGENSVVSEQAIDFKDLATSYTVEFTQEGNVADKTLVETAVSFTNKSTAQDYFAGKDFGVEVSNGTTIDCTIAQ